LVIEAWSTQDDPWIAQQLRKAFPDSCRYRYAIFDRDNKFGMELVEQGHETHTHLPRKPLTYMELWNAESSGLYPRLS